MKNKKRATTIAEWQALEEKLFSSHEEVFKRAGQLEVRPTDVIITPYAKCGTTWLQQIFHQLRTGGDMDFDDISRVVPWIETAPMIAIDINAEQRANPRGFKSHLPFDKLPSGGKAINAFRHPADAAWSMFKFMEGWFIEPGTISPDAVVTRRFIDEDDYFEHVASFLEQKDNEHVLLLAYEHMLKDPAGTIRRVADFCDIALDDALLSLVLERASISYMQQYKDRFDDAMMREMTERDLLPAGSDSAKVRSGKAGEHAAGLSPMVLEKISARWRDTIGRNYGYQTYEDLLAALD